MTWGSDLLISETLSSRAFPAEDHSVEPPSAGQEVELARVSSKVPGRRLQAIQSFAGGCDRASPRLSLDHDLRVLDD